MKTDAVHRPLDDCDSFTGSQGQYKDTGQEHGDLNSHVTHTPRIRILLSLHTAESEVL